MKKGRFIRRSFVMFLLAYALVSHLDAQSKPNVVIIFTDDVGYGDVSCYGATKLSTPHIDRLAEEGCMFKDAHSASAVCTPSRYALLTGEYPFRADHGKGVWGPLPQSSRLIIDVNKLTIADVMKNSGYATACIGKWHLGFGNTTPTNWNNSLTPGPLQLGFDYYYGIPYVNSGPPFVFVENEKVVGLDPDDPLVLNGEPVTPTPYYPDKGHNIFSGGKKAHSLYKDEDIAKVITEKAADWIRNQEETPFFLYMSTTHIHHPFSPHPDFQGTSQCGRYGDFVQELDWMVGQILKTLNEEGIRDNTLIIFTSDNGGMLNVGGQEAWNMGHRMNGGLLGFKFDAWEGGHRVPFIVSWPGMVEKGSESSQLICNVDLLSTLAAVCGYELSEEDAPDSFNMLDAFTGNPAHPIRNHLVITPRIEKNMALRVGEWMYIGARGGGGFFGNSRGGHILGGPAALAFTGEKNSDISDGDFIPNAPDEQLYHLDLDLSQSENVSGKHPDITFLMKELLNTIKQTKQTR
jgi:arylsulfatase A-like enzyme